MKYFNIILFSILSFGYLNAEEYPNYIINKCTYSSNYYHNLIFNDCDFFDNKLIVAVLATNNFDNSLNKIFFVNDSNGVNILKIDSLNIQFYSLSKNLNNYFIADTMYRIIDLNKHVVYKENTKETFLIPYIHYIDKNGHLINSYKDTSNVTRFTYPGVSLVSYCFDYLYISDNMGIAFLWDKNGNKMNTSYSLKGKDDFAPISSFRILNKDDEHIYSLIFTYEYDINYVKKNIINGNFSSKRVLNYLKDSISNNFFSFCLINNEFYSTNYSLKKDNYKWTYFNKYDKDFTLIDSYLISTDTLVHLSYVAGLNDGSFILYGVKQYKEPGDIVSKTKYHMIHINKNGGIKRTYEWGEFYSYKIERVFQRSDGKLIVVGRDTDSLKKYSTISTFIIDLDINSIDATEKKDNWLDINPIPANNYINIKNSNYTNISEFLIFDSNAKLVSKFKLQYENQIQIDVSNYAKGAYYIVPNSNEANIFAGTKFIVE